MKKTKNNQAAEAVGEARANGTHLEMWRGVGGGGEITYSVVTVSVEGCWRHQEVFTSKPEATCWMDHC